MDDCLQCTQHMSATPSAVMLGSFMAMGCAKDFVTVQSLRKFALVSDKTRMLACRQVVQL